MISLTSTAQGDVPGRRQGRSRALAAYQARTRACSGDGGMAVWGVLGMARESSHGLK